MGFLSLFGRRRSRRVTAFDAPEPAPADAQPAMEVSTAEAEVAEVAEAAESLAAVPRIVVLSERDEDALSDSDSSDVPSARSSVCSTDSRRSSSSSSSSSSASEEPSLPAPSDIRVALASAPSTLAILDELWDAVHAPRTDVRPAPESMDFDRYMRAHLMIQRTVLNLQNKDVARGAFRAKRDWEVDRQGGPSVLRARFYASVVQIGVIQCKALPSAPYEAALAARCCEYLRAFVEAMTVVDGRAGCRRLRLSSELSAEVLETLARAAKGAGAAKSKEAPISYRARSVSPRKEAVLAPAPPAASPAPSLKRRAIQNHLLGVLRKPTALSNITASDYLN